MVARARQAVRHDPFQGRRSDPAGPQARRCRGARPRRDQRAELAPERRAQLLSRRDDLLRNLANLGIGEALLSRLKRYLDRQAKALFALIMIEKASVRD